MCKTGFTHDQNARNDERLLNVRAHEGAEGYGIYFMILERLFDSEEFTCVRDYRLLAFDFRVSAGKVKRVVEDYDLFLFTPDGTRFYSERFARQMKEAEKAAQKRAISGKKGAESRWEKQNEMALPSKSMANAIDNDGNAIPDEKDAKPKEERETPPHTPYKEKEENKYIYNYARACEEKEAGAALEGYTDVDPEPKDDSETIEPPAGADHNGASTETLQVTGETLQAETVEAETVQEEGPVKPKRKRKRKTFDENGEMIKPTVEEVAAYVREKGYTDVDPELFVSHYGARGWMMGKNKMKDWRLAVVIWKKYEEKGVFKTGQKNGAYSRRDREESERIARQNALLRDIAADEARFLEEHPEFKERGRTASDKALAVFDGGAPEDDENPFI